MKTIPLFVISLIGLAASYQRFTGCVLCGSVVMTFAVYVKEKPNMSKREVRGLGVATKKFSGLILMKVVSFQMKKEICRDVEKRTMDDELTDLCFSILEEIIKDSRKLRKIGVCLTHTFVISSPCICQQTFSFMLDHFSISALMSPHGFSNSARMHCQKPTAIQRSVG